MPPTADEVKEKVANGDIRTAEDLEKWLREDYPELLEKPNSIPSRVAHFIKGTYGQPLAPHARPEKETYLDRGLKMYEEIKDEISGKALERVEKLYQDLKDLKSEKTILESQYSTGAIKKGTYNKRLKPLEKQAKEKVKNLSKLEKKVEKEESKKTSKIIKGLGTLVKKAFKGTGNIIDNIDYFLEELGPPKLKKELRKYAKDKKTQYVILLFILIIAAGAFFSISEPSTTSFIIFGQEDTLNYKLLAGTLLLFLTIYLVHKRN